MLVKEIFQPIGISQSFGGLTTFLGHDDCQVENKTRNEGSVLLHLKRESDGTEGHAYLRVQKDYADISDQLLDWAFAEPRIIGLTINELFDLETGIRISLVNGKLQVSFH